uniref:Uncharacterized protein n=1 Tax=viral metagenome TaxID=1070528 RepID=A0A6M3IF87_9ZZZZ
MKKILLVLIVLCLAAGEALAISQATSSTTSTTAIVRARYYLNETTASFWTDAELLSWMNDAQIDIVSRTKSLQTTQVITLAANTHTYSITVSYLSIEGAVYSPTGGTSSGFYKQGLLRGHPAHVGHTSPREGPPKYYYEWKSDIGIYPPLGTIAGETVTLYAISRPAAMTSTTVSSIQTPAMFDRAIILYTVAQAFYKDKQYGKAGRFMAEYYAEIDRYRQDYVLRPKEPLEMQKD